MSKKVGEVKIGFKLDENLQQLPELTERIGTLIDLAELVEPQQAQRIEQEIKMILFDLIGTRN